ncbi:MAG: glycosyltransferase family 4 protein [Candidatus Eisenbacteria bacterium]
MPPSPTTRVAMVLDGSGIGGVERHVGDLTEGLARLLGDRIELHVVVGGDGPLIETVRRAGARVRRIERDPSLLYVARLARCLAALRPALVHAHSGRLACLAARLAGVPLVIETRHGIRERDARLYRVVPAARRLEWAKSSLVDTTVAVCQDDLAWLRGAARFPAERTRLIPNGVESPGLSAAQLADARGRLRAQWRIDPAALLLGYVGRLSHEKSPDRALAVLGALRQGGHDAQLAMFGDGAMCAALRLRADALGLASRVHWFGIVRERDTIYPGLDLLLMPSRREGLPYALLDALAYTVPALVTPVGGMTELLDPAPLRDSLLAFDAGQWAARAVQLMRGTTRESWRRAALHRVSDFTRETMVRSLVALYGERLSARGASTVFDRPPRC